MTSQRLHPHSLTQLDTTRYPSSGEDRLVKELIALKLKLAEVRENIDIGELQRNRDVRMLQGQIRNMQSNLGIAGGETPKTYEIMRNVTSPSPRPEDVADEKVQYVK